MASDPLAVVRACLNAYVAKTRETGGHHLQNVLERFMMGHSSRRS
jgi:hypothetical protein